MCCGQGRGMNGQSRRPAARVHMWGRGVGATAGACPNALNHSPRCPHDSGWGFKCRAAAGGNTGSATDRAQPSCEGPCAASQGGRRRKLTRPRSTQGVPRFCDPLRRVVGVPFRISRGGRPAAPREETEGKRRKEKRNQEERQGEAEDTGH